MAPSTFQKLSVVTVMFAASALIGAARQDARPAPAPIPGAVMLVVKLVNPEPLAAKGWATVQVTATGVQLVDPATVGDTPTPGQAHLHYQVDTGPVVATPSPKLSFHELKPGEHIITVTLVGNDHKPIGAPQMVRVSVPGAIATR